MALLKSSSDSEEIFKSIISRASLKYFSASLFLQLIKFVKIILMKNKQVYFRTVFS